MRTCWTTRAEALAITAKRQLLKGSLSGIAARSAALGLTVPTSSSYRSSEMPTADRQPLDDIRDQIQPNELAKHGFPRPKRVSLIEGNDSEGEEAFHIYLVFPDDTRDEDLAWNKIEPMVSWVRKFVWEKTGQTRWPYVRVKREKEILDEL
jgi:hypothetical protein